MTPVVAMLETRLPRRADDPAAHVILRRAQGAFQKWPEGFRGFRAEVECVTAATGTIEVAPHGVRVDLPDPDVASLVATTLVNLADDRTPRFFKDGDGRFVLSFAGDDAEPSGHTIRVHGDDGVRLTYRVDAAGRLRVVDREAGGVRTVTSYETLVRATPGRVLPAVTVTTVIRQDTGDVVRVERIEDTHARVDHVWLPATRRIVVRTGHGSREWRLRFSGHALLYDGGAILPTREEPKACRATPGSSTS